VLTKGYTNNYKLWGGDNRKSHYLVIVLGPQKRGERGSQFGGKIWEDRRGSGGGEKSYFLSRKCKYCLKLLAKRVSLNMFATLEIERRKKNDTGGTKTNLGVDPQFNNTLSIQATHDRMKE